MKRFILLAFIIGTFGHLFARHIDSSEALVLAKNFFYENTKTRSSNNLSFSLAYVSSDKLTTRGKELTHFYVYNIEGDNGFVIVSADTRTKLILAYSEKGKFEKENMPENLKSWLSFYADEIRYAINTLPDISYEEKRTIQTSEKFAKVVKPLLGNISYNQGSPYNKLCPKMKNDQGIDENTWVGCTATAIAQVMCYHKWPKQGKGSKTYTSKKNKFELSVDFGSTTYDWEHIRSFYGKNYTEEEANAVATLMYHVGVSIEMDYDLEGSGAYVIDGAKALFKHFNYDAGVQYFYKSYFSHQEWIEKLKTEFNEKRPVIYAGGNSKGGHAFVLDGYDENNKFHVNWGWGGHSDGYYELSSLNPEEQGVGSSDGGYNRGQEMITGIQKPIEGSSHSYVFVAERLTASSLSLEKEKDPISITLKSIQNVGAFAYSASLKVALALYNSNGLFGIWKDSEQDFSLKNDQIYFNNLSFALVPEGEYTIKPVYKLKNDAYETININTETGAIINVKVKENQVTLTPVYSDIYLEHTSAPKPVNTFKSGGDGKIELKIANRGKKEYNAMIGIKLFKWDEENKKWESDDFSKKKVAIVSGETKTFEMGGKLTDEGIYYIITTYDLNNDFISDDFPWSWVNSDKIVEFSVPVFGNLTQKPWLIPVDVISSSVNKNQAFKISANIKNIGNKEYDGYVTAALFKLNENESFLDCGAQPVNFAVGETKIIEFAFKELNVEEAGTYRIGVFYKGKETEKRDAMFIKSFEVHDPSTAKKNFIILGTPVATENILSESNILEIISNPIGSYLDLILPIGSRMLMIYNLQGVLMKSIALFREGFTSIPVQNLTPGIYVVTVVTNDGQNFSSKIIKQ